MFVLPTPHAKKKQRVGGSDAEEVLDGISGVLCGTGSVGKCAESDNGEYNKYDEGDGDEEQYEVADAPTPVNKREPALSSKRTWAAISIHAKLKRWRLGQAEARQARERGHWETPGLFDDVGQQVATLNVFEKYGAARQVIASPGACWPASCTTGSTRPAPPDTGISVSATSTRWVCRRI